MSRHQTFQRNISKDSVAGPREFPAKLVLLGQAFVGKSSIAIKFDKDQFSEMTNSNTRADYFTQSVQLSSGQTVKFDIWDTAGQERFAACATMYYRGAQAAIVVYDITEERTLIDAKEWVEVLRGQTSGNIVIVLAGNKADLAAERRAVPTEIAHAYAKDNGLIFTEVSAKTGLGIREMFMVIANKLVSKSSGEEQVPSQNVRLVATKERPSSGRRC